MICAKLFDAQTNKVAADRVWPLKVCSSLHSLASALLRGPEKTLALCGTRCHGFPDPLILDPQDAPAALAWCKGHLRLGRRLSRRKPAAQQCNSKLNCPRLSQSACPRAWMFQSCTAPLAVPWPSIASHQCFAVEQLKTWWDFPGSRSKPGCFWAAACEQLRLAQLRRALFDDSATAALGKVAHPWWPSKLPNCLFRRVLNLKWDEETVSWRTPSWLEETMCK